MILHCVILRDEVSRFDDVDLDDGQLAASTERRTDTLVQNLAELNEVVLKLQAKNCTLRQKRAYFHSVVDVYPTLEARLSPDTCLVHSPTFKKCCSKDSRIQRGRSENLVKARSKMFSFP